MSYKMGLLLSLVFVMSVMLLGGDLVCLTSIHNQLDALSITVAHRFETDGALLESTKRFIEANQARIRVQNDYVPAIGEEVTFTLYRPYQSFVMSNEEMMISVTRTAVVGYYRTY